MSSGLTKTKRKRLNKNKEWKKEVEAEDQTDVIEKWVETVRANGGWRVGRWRPLREVKNFNNLKEVRRYGKQESLVAIFGRKVNLYFFLQEGFATKEYCERVESHPLTATFALKPVEEWNVGLGRMISHDHLSPHDFESRRLATVR